MNIPLATTSNICDFGHLPDILIQILNLIEDGISKNNFYIFAYFTTNLYAVAHKTKPNVLA